MTFDDDSLVVNWRKENGQKKSWKLKYLIINPKKAVALIATAFSLQIFSFKIESSF